MRNEQRSQYLNRRDILSLLSDEEIAQVSAEDKAVPLSEGDEYLDLGDLEHGVRRARGAAMSMRHVLPRKAVHADTWSDILVQLEMLRVAPPESGVMHVARRPLESWSVATSPRVADELVASE